MFSAHSKALRDTTHGFLRLSGPMFRTCSNPLLNLGLAGFEMRDDDKGGLSVTEIEHYGTMSPEARAVAAYAFRESLDSKKLSTNGIFAHAEIAKVKAAALGYNKAVRIVHDPVSGNPGHAEVRHFKDEDIDLLEHFAKIVFDNYEVVADMDIAPRP